MYKASSGNVAGPALSGGTSSGSGGGSGLMATPAKKPRLTAMSPSSASPAGRGGFGGKNAAGMAGPGQAAAGAAAAAGVGAWAGGGARHGGPGGTGAAGMLVVKKADVEKGILVEVKDEARVVVVVVLCFFAGALMTLLLVPGCCCCCCICCGQRARSQGLSPLKCERAWSAACSVCWNHVIYDLRFTLEVPFPRADGGCCRATPKKARLCHLDRSTPCSTACHV